MHGINGISNRVNVRKPPEFILSCRTDGTKEYHLWHCAQRALNPYSLLDNSFEF